MGKAVSMALSNDIAKLLSLSVLELCGLYMTPVRNLQLTKWISTT